MLQKSAEIYYGMNLWHLRNNISIPLSVILERSFIQLFAKKKGAEDINSNGFNNTAKKNHMAYRQNITVQPILSNTNDC